MPKIIYKPEDIEDDSIYFVVEVQEDETKYAYYMTSNHIRTVINNSESWKNYKFIGKEVLDKECDLSRESGPFIHIIKVC